MKQIENLWLARLNNGAHFQYMTFVTTRADADSTVSTKASKELAALKAALAEEDTNLKLTNKSFITDEITAADEERDNHYRLYRRLVKGNVGHPVESVGQAAKVLAQHLKDYAIDPKMQLDRETGLLTNLITDLEGKYATEVAALGLTSIIPLMKAANTRVATALASRTDESMTRAVGILKKSRAATDEAYAAFVQKVNALSVVEGETSYANFIDYVNTTIVRYRREVLGQKSDAASTDSGSTDTGSTDTDEGEDTGDSGSSSGDRPEIM